MTVGELLEELIELDPGSSVELDVDVEYDTFYRSHHLCSVDAVVEDGSVTWIKGRER